MLGLSRLVLKFRKCLDVSKKNAVCRVIALIFLSVCFVATVCGFAVGWFIILSMVLLFLILKVQRRLVYRWGGNRAVYKKVWF